MRFPFTFMGLLSVAFALWTVAYFLTHRAYDPVVTGSGYTAAVLMFAFGVYVLVRRLRHGPQA